MTNLNMVFYVVMPVNRFVKIWNSTQSPDEFRNGQFDQNFRKFRLNIEWNRNFPEFASKISVHFSRLSFFLEIWKFQKCPVPLAFLPGMNLPQFLFSREKLQDGSETFESTLHWMQNDLPQFEPVPDCLSGKLFTGRSEFPVGQLAVFAYCHRREIPPPPQS